MRRKVVSSLPLIVLGALSLLKSQDIIDVAIILILITMGLYSIFHSM